MTDNERDLLRCAAILRQIMTDAMEKLGTPITVAGTNKQHVEGTGALAFLKDRNIDLLFPLDPMEGESVEAAAHRIFGNYIYNQVFKRHPGGQ